jgi:hypothetical protein
VAFPQQLIALVFRLSSKRREERRGKKRRD